MTDGIIFSSFDFLEGLIDIFSSVNKEIVKKISLKVLYAALTGYNSQIEDNDKTITSS